MSAGPGDATIAEAALRLREGGLVAFPTETVYGLGANALDERAVARVFALKKRPATNPLIVHVPGAEQARGLTAGWSAGAEALAGAFWPGPLTIVLPRAADVPSIVAAGGDTVALRAPDHPVAQALLAAAGLPLVGPSANPSGLVSPTAAGHVRGAFAEAVASGELLVLDGGPCRAGIESTVVTLAERRPRILRRGVVSAEQISAVLRAPVVDRDAGAAEESGGPLAGPGMLAAHYAPRTPLSLFEAERWPEVLDELPAPLIVLTHERARSVEPPSAIFRLPRDASAYAAALYAALHEADAGGFAHIAAEEPSSPGPVWDAVRDRLRRAAARR
ncbi:MAG: L-threonylcarbamoyladenylate synthase [Planctomycetota bacterium]|nr:L-threonylcarbamoyladenylate synthase [Planctomycetota bacterium]